MLNAEVTLLSKSASKFNAVPAELGVFAKLCVLGGNH